MPQHAIRYTSEKPKLRHLQWQMCAHSREKATTSCAGSPKLAWCTDFQSVFASSAETNNYCPVNTCAPLPAIALYTRRGLVGPEILS